MMIPPESRIRTTTTAQTFSATSWWSIFVLFLLSFPVRCSSYRVGDIVDTILRTAEGSTDVLNSQMPMFGVQSTAVFSETPDRFSLAFHEGLRPLPWIETVDNTERALKEITVTFVYSESGDGAIHAVSSEATYSKEKSSDEGFRVRYQWVEEEEVDLQAGSAVMFLAVCIVSIIVLLQSCGETGAGASLSDNSFGTATPYESYGQETQVASGMPKWD